MQSSGKKPSIGWVKCYSKSSFAELKPDSGVVAISIQDEPGGEISLKGWRAYWRGYFTDVEYDEEYIRVWGWELAEQAGLFMPSMAEELRTFLMSESVYSAEGLVIHCHAGRSRSIAVGEFASELYKIPLIIQRENEANKTVLKLLRDPHSMEKAKAFDKEEKKKKEKQSWWQSIW